MTLDTLVRDITELPYRPKSEVRDMIESFLEEQQYADTKIIAYAIADNGEGRVMRIGEYEDWDEIEIVCGLFTKDTIINFEQK